MPECSLYIHIPYCYSRCCYCDFHSNAAGSVPNEYVAALQRHLCDFKDSAATVYIGGGTPSLLDEKQLRVLCESIPVKSDTEFTIEANPDSITKKFLSTALSCKINRLSIGVQSLDDETLAFLGRRHTARQALSAVIAAQSAGFENISVDFIIGTPGQSLFDIEKFALFAADISVSHISAYILKVEDTAPLALAVQRGAVVLPDDDRAAQLYEYAVVCFENMGYKRYEISNFAKENRQSRHNLQYWNCLDYVGIGPGAHSCTDNKRYYYMRNTEKFVLGLSPLISDGECIADDFIMLQTRLDTGLSRGELFSRYGYIFNDKQQEKLQKFAVAGFVTLTGDRIILTTKGLLIQNSILCELFCID